MTAACCAVFSPSRNRSMEKTLLCFCCITSNGVNIFEIEVNSNTRRAKRESANSRDLGSENPLYPYRN